MGRQTKRQQQRSGGSSGGSSGAAQRAARTRRRRARLKDLGVLPFLLLLLLDAQQEITARRGLGLFSIGRGGSSGWHH